MWPGHIWCGHRSTRVTIGGMTDPNTAQATALIAALQDQLAAMAPRLAQAELDACPGPPEYARAIRLYIAQLRRDVHHAQFLIARLHQRFPAAEVCPPILVADVE